MRQARFSCKAAVCYIVLGGILSATYVLSAGPVLQMVNNGRLPQWVLKMYLPLRVTICQEERLLAPAYRNYLWRFSVTIPTDLQSMGASFPLHNLPIFACPSSVAAP